MQGEVPQLVMSVEGRLNAIARERWISTVSHELAPLKKDVTDRAKTGKVGDLSEEVSSELKDGEWSLEKPTAVPNTKFQ